MTGFRVRNTVRVLLLDEQDRLLLFLSARRAWWQAAGGAIERDEGARAAAVREITEETGLHNVDLRSEVWRRRSMFTWQGIEVDQHERWLVARAAHFAPDTSGQSEYETADLAQWRWWTVPELHATTQQLVPSDLAGRLDDLLVHGAPAQPIEVGL